jgi:hypothetical protein
VPDRRHLDDGDEPQDGERREGGEQQDHRPGDGAVDGMAFGVDGGYAESQGGEDHELGADQGDEDLGEAFRHMGRSRPDQRRQGQREEERRQVDRRGPNHQLQPQRQGPQDHHHADRQLHDRGHGEAHPLHEAPEDRHGALGSDEGAEGVDHAQCLADHGDRGPGGGEADRDADGVDPGQPAQVLAGDGTDRRRGDHRCGKEGPHLEHGRLAYPEPHPPEPDLRPSPAEGRGHVQDQPDACVGHRVHQGSEDAVCEALGQRVGTGWQDAAEEPRRADVRHCADHFVTDWPWPTKKLMIVGAAPTSSAARPETRTPFRPL